MWRKHNVVSGTFTGLWIVLAFTQLKNGVLPQMAFGLYQGSLIQIRLLNCASQSKG